jgi:hypothetical protein
MFPCTYFSIVGMYRLMRLLLAGVLRCITASLKCRPPPPTSRRRDRPAQASLSPTPSTPRRRTSQAPPHTTPSTARQKQPPPHQRRPTEPDRRWTASAGPFRTSRRRGRPHRRVRPSGWTTSCRSSGSLSRSTAAVGRQRRPCLRPVPLAANHHRQQQPQVKTARWWSLN